MEGNLSISEMEIRTGISFPEKLKKILTISRQENQDIFLQENEWYCFDKPFMIVCGSMEFAQKLYSDFRDFEDLMVIKPEFGLEEMEGE